MPAADFRSDTVTRPTSEMQDAMARAEVGDDVLGEDPTVRALEALAAERTGKEAGLFVASGTMGNLTAILCHAGRGDEAICGREAHAYVWEAGGMAALGGVVPHPLPTDERGRMDPDEVERAVRPDDVHFPKSRLLLLEDTFSGRGGAALPVEYLRSMETVARRHGLFVHLDGARLFNAAVALGVDARTLCEPVDSVSFCLSKGLSAPVGSVLCGSRAFVDKARRVRKSLGGGMRQAGVLAAAGLVALESMIERLAEDHTKARRLALGLAAIDGVELDPERVDTNIVHFRVTAPGWNERELVSALRREHEILAGVYPGPIVRALTHREVGDADVDRFVAAVKDLLSREGPAVSS